MDKFTDLTDVRLVLFDLDGVLLNSQKNMAASWTAVQRELEISTPFETYFENIGMPFKDIMHRIGLSEVAVRAEEIYSTASKENRKLLNWYPGVFEVLSELESCGIKSGIVTSKETKRTESILAELPVKFNTVQTPIASLRGKPAPDHLLVACAHTHTDPMQTLFVGDMTVDFQAARRAGVPFAFAKWGYGSNMDGPCLELPSLYHLQGLLAVRLAA